MNIHKTCMHMFNIGKKTAKKVVENINLIKTVRHT